MANHHGFLLEQALGFNVNRTAFLLSEEIAHQFKQAGHPLSAQDFGILFALHTNNGMNQAEIIKRMMRDKTTITRRLNALLKKAYIERHTSEEDRRAIIIQLSKQGQEAIPTLIALVSEFQKSVLENIPDTDRITTINTLKTISNTLIRNKQ